MNHKEVRKFTKENYSDIAICAIHSNKRHTAERFGISSKAVEMCLHRYGRDDLVSSSMLKRFTKKSISPSINTKLDFWEKLTEGISENPGQTLFKALREMFDEISVKDRQIKELNQVVDCQKKNIEDIDEKLKKCITELESLKKNYHTEQTLNKKLVLESARSALMVSGD